VAHPNVVRFDVRVGIFDCATPGSQESSFYLSCVHAIVSVKLTSS
jgi:hypothetical protein